MCPNLRKVNQGKTNLLLASVINITKVDCKFYKSLTGIFDR
jgi:hypothetical protein